MSAHQSRRRRAALYMPATNARAIQKARDLAVDAVILDLEDSVAPEAKVEARDNVIEAIASPFGDKEVTVRINTLDTPWGAEDLEAVAAAGPDAIVVPKVSTADDLVDLYTRVSRIDPAVHVWPMLESPRAIMNARELSEAARQAGGQVDNFLVGTNDLVKDTGASKDQGRQFLQSWLATFVALAKAADATILDGPFNDFKDLRGLAAECEHGAMLGMDGKTIIHPAQIDTVVTAFAPTPEQLQWARAVVAAFELPENAKRGVISVDGEMVERLHLEIAQRFVARSGD